MLNKTSSRLRDEAALLTLMEDLALAAGRTIMQHREAGIQVEHKADDSPVTAADRDAECVLLHGLAKAVPDVACVSEEAASENAYPSVVGKDFFLIDPLDGTKEYIQGRPDFTVNLALIQEGQPRLGVVYAPAHSRLYSGRPGAAFEVELHDGSIRARRQILARLVHSPPTIVASRSHSTTQTENYIARFAGATTILVGSSFKFGILARGDADLYPRFGRTMQWDTAAGDAVLRAAGGRVCTLDGMPLCYGPNTAAGQDIFANPFFIAEGKVE